jgi:hypothetical protein
MNGEHRLNIQLLKKRTVHWLDLQACRRGLQYLVNVHLFQIFCTPIVTLQSWEVPSQEVKTEREIYCNKAHWLQKKMR